MKEYNKLMSEIAIIKQSLLAIERNCAAVGGWLPKRAVMRYFDYADNQLRLLEKTKALQVSKIGRRKFYSLESIIKLIKENQQK
jgi:hypothetical protein